MRKTVEQFNANTANNSLKICSMKLVLISSVNTFM